MSDIKNPLSAESYTNKDFQSIYLELLDTAKLLAKNWDPTISNESDPGVVLLKLNAIIADKNNYNIDKNILENYPDTYTQEISARSQYNQLGYKMPWYRAATTKIGFRWVGEKFIDGDSLIIPKYTMLMDNAGTYVYTILSDAILGKIQKRATDTCEVPAIQGVINTLKLSGSTVISLANLDSKNRLFINDQYIAENGIYVTSEDDPNGVLWSQVDNIELEQHGTKCYEFNIDPKRNIPYLQFPEDIRDLIKTGIVVKYIVTNGYNGNVAAKTIDSFYDQGSVTLNKNNGEKANIPLTSENFLVYNTEGTVNGQDPEDIDSARRSFKRQVCTFDTLITLRDYINAIYTFGKEENALSNIIVTDRTNDIQSTYRIVDKDESLLGYVDYMSYTPITRLVDITSTEDVEYGHDTIFEKNSDGDFLVKPIIEKPTTITSDTLFVKKQEKDYDMTAFDLKFYVLKNGGLLNTLDAYARTFDIDNTEETRSAILTHLSDLKAVQHDVVDIKKQIPFMLQNVYPIKIKLVPTFKLNDVAINEVTNNIKTTLIDLLNSRNCDFGAEPSYDIIYNAIMSCDERIKVLILEDFKYTTFATYLGYSNSDKSGDLEFKYIPISDYSTCSRLIVKDSTSCGCEGCANTLAQINSEFIELFNDPTLNLETIKESLKKNLTINSMNESEIEAMINYVKTKLSDTSLNTVDKKVKFVNNFIVENLIKYRLQQAADKILGNTSVNPTDKQIESYRFIDSVNGIMYKWPKKLTTLEVTPGYDPRALEVYSNRLLDIRTEVIARNVLAGVTPLFDIPTSTFNTSLNMNQVDGLTAAVSDIKTDLTIAPFGFNAQYSDEEKRVAAYTLRANESLRFLAPSFISDRTYSNYVKYELVLKNPILSNSEYTSADPADEEALFKQYGTSHFYVQSANNVYSPLFSSKYERLTDIPTFKLNYHHGIQRGFGENKEIITNSNHFENSTNTLDKICSKVKTYVPEFERYLYYKKDNGIYKVITSYYEGFNDDLNHNNIYRLKHYVYDYIIVDSKEPFVSNKYYFHDGTVYKSIKAISSSADEHFIYDCACNLNAYKVYIYDAEKNDFIHVTDDNVVKIPENTTTSYYVKVSNVSTEYLKEYALKADSVTRHNDDFYIKLSRAEISAVKYIIEKSSIDAMTIFKLGNVIDVGDCTKSTNFEPVKSYSSNVYLKLEKNGQTVGYKVIESNTLSYLTNKDRLKELIVNAYTSIKSDLKIEDITIDKLIERGSIVVATAPITWKNKYNKSYYVKYLDHEKIGSTAIMYVRPSAPPDYTLVTCLEKKTNGNQVVYEDIKENPSSTLIDEWDIKYSQAYYQANYEGLHTSSPEYLKWKNGSLALYVKKSSYRIEANTEYQLREGDYIVFFWRSTDADDAPYTYRKYEYIYDETTGQKTIIKPNFSITASSYGNSLISKHGLKDGGTIPYSADNDSKFQKIFQYMYDEYDLSGSRQIEIRKMNSVKLDADDNKYYYFIRPEVETITDDETKVSRDTFSMNFVYAKTWQDKNGVDQYKFQHTLEPDEYFIYMNSDQTLYEILGEGTLIEYNVSGLETIPTVGDIQTFVVTAIDSNEILYEGIDAFREYCKTVQTNEVFNLIEQQVYSFVKGDTVQISLKDNVGYSYDKLEAKPESNGYYLHFDFNLVTTHIDNDMEVIEPYVDGEYYTLKNGVDKTDATFEDFEKVALKPEGWDNVTNWYSGGVHYNKYYRLSYKEYISQEDALKNTSIYNRNDSWYKRVNPKYPVFSTTLPVSIKDFNISYSTSNNSSENTNQLDLNYSTLPAIDIEDDSYGWMVTAHLNVMCDNQKPQKIEISSDNNQSAQRIEISGNKFPDKFFYEFTDAEKAQLIKDNDNQIYDDYQAFIKKGETYLPAIEKEDELYILSSIPLDKVGSSYIDVSYVDLLGERHDTDIFAYTLNSISFKSSSICEWLAGDDGLILKLEPGTTLEFTIPSINLDPSYKYLLPVSVQNEDVTIKFESTGTPLKCVCCEESELGGTAFKGKHFIELYNGLENLKITACNNDTQNDISILFGILFKYKYRDIYGGDYDSETGNFETVPKYGVNTLDILKKIREIDVPGKFKYIHVPSIDVKIDDPLDPISMFDTNHVYNKFTLARAELDSAKPYDGSYDIVNNK